MSNYDSTVSDPSGWSDERLEAHTREWCSLPLRRPGPIPVPHDHPDLGEEPEDEEIPLGEWLGGLATAAVFVAAVATVVGLVWLVSLHPGVAMYASVTQ